MSQRNQFRPEVRLSDMASSDVVEHIAATDVHSGGGTAAAIAASLAVASASLVVSLNGRRRSNADRQDELTTLAATLSRFRERMLAHADHDAAVLASLMESHSQRKKSDENRNHYRTQLVAAAESGLALIDDLRSFLEALSGEADRTPRFLVSDIGAAAALALGSHRATRLTTMANIVELGREQKFEAADRIAERLTELDEDVEALADDIYRTVEAMIAGDDPRLGGSA